MLKVVAPLLIVTVLAFSMIFLANQKNSTNLSSNAAALTTVSADLGLKVNAELFYPDSVTIHTSWNKKLLDDPNLLFFTEVVRQANDDTRQDSEPRNVGRVSSKDYSVSFCPGDHYVRLRAVYKNSTAKIQEVNFSYQSPLVNGQRELLGNTSFEKIYPPVASKPDDLDPACWMTSEGLMTENGATGIEQVEHPLMLQTVGPTGNVTPHSGNFMVKNATELGLKAHFKHYYAPAVTSGTLIQKFSLYIPSGQTFLQQFEIRKKIAGEDLHIRWANDWTHYCIRNNPDKNVDSKGFCVNDAPPLSPDVWHTYIITLKKQLKNTDRWFVDINLDGTSVFKTSQKTTDGRSVPTVAPIDNQFGFLFVGDECQANFPTNPCDGLGTIFFDDVEAYQLP